MAGIWSHPDESRRLPDALVLKGRDQAIHIARPHRVLGTSLHGPFAEGLQQIQLGMGCFWGAERRFWQQPGIVTTAAGYSGGVTLNPTYEEVCSGRTKHAETVLVVFDPQKTTLAALLKLFWESHDPTQGMRQGNDQGTQYRSVLYLPDAASLAQAEASRDQFQAALRAAGRGDITTEVLGWQPFYYAEEYHQQYLDANPSGYCGLRGTGVCLV